MKLNSGKILKIFGTCISYGGFYNSLPYKWDSKTSTVHPVSPTRFTIWTYFVYIILLYQVFLTYVLSKSLLFTSNPLRFYILKFAFFLNYSMVAVTQACMLFRWKEWISFINQAIAFFKFFEENHLKLDAPTPNWQKIFEIMFQFLLLCAIFCPVATALLMANYPCSEILISSKFPNPENIYSILFINLPINLGIQLVIWAAAIPMLIFGSHWTFATIFILKEFSNKPDKRVYRNHKIHETFTILHTYRCLQILTASFDSIFGEFVFPPMNDLAISVVVVINFILIRLNQDFGLISHLLFVVVFLLWAFYLIMTHKKFGEVYELSKKSLKLLGRNQLHVLRIERIYVQSCVRANPGLRIHLGTFGYYKKANTVRIVGKVVTYTMRFLILTAP